MSDITALLNAAANGDDDAFGVVIGALYGDLERLTASRMRLHFGRQLDQLTLMPGDLLHEAMVRLMNERALARSRKQFFAIAATLISRVIVDYQRRRLAEKRGGRGGRGVALNAGVGREPSTPAGDETKAELFERFQRAMDGLIADDPEAAEVLAMRAWGRFRRAQIIEMTGLSPSVVDRAWRRGCERIERELAG